MARGAAVQILAVHPQEFELAVFEKMPPLGMLWIASVLRKAGFGIEFLDQQVDDRDVVDLARVGKPRLLLIGGTTHGRFACFRIVKEIKRVSPETVIVFGGPHATFTAEDTLTHVPEVDIIVHGEGEEQSVELADWAINGGAPTRELAKIRGISFREQGGITRTSPRPLIEDLDGLGLPARDLVPMERYEMMMDFLDLKGMSIMTARGCPIMCSFCSAAAMFGVTYRTRSPKLVVDEIELLMSRYGAQGIKIFDSTFTLSKRHVEQFCTEIRRRSLKFPWECEVRVGSVDKQLLALMQESGCYYVDVGVESGSQRVLDEGVRKKISIEDAQALLRWTKELALLTKVFFTVGHPGETYKESLQTLGFIRRNRRHIRLQAFQAGIRVYPGTGVAEYAEKHGLLPKGFRWSAPYENLVNRKLFRAIDNVPLLIQPGMGVRELRRLRLRFIAMRLLSLRFVVEKLKAITGQRAISDYIDIVFGGILGRTHNRPH